MTPDRPTSPLDRATRAAIEIESLTSRIRSLRAEIRSRRCTEYSKPDMSCGDDGAPPCYLALIPTEDFCEHCISNGKARHEVAVLKKDLRLAMGRLLRAAKRLKGESA